MTALMNSVNKGYRYIFNDLLAANADIHLKDRNGTYILFFSKDNPQYDQTRVIVGKRLYSNLFLRKRP